MGLRRAIRKGGLQCDRAVAEAEVDADLRHGVAQVHRVTGGGRRGGRGVGTRHPIGESDGFGAGSGVVGLRRPDGIPRSRGRRDDTVVGLGNVDTPGTLRPRLEAVRDGCLVGDVQLGMADRVRQRTRGVGDAVVSIGARCVGRWLIDGVLHRHVDHHATMVHPGGLEVIVPRWAHDLAPGHSGGARGASDRALHRGSLAIGVVGLHVELPRALEDRGGRQGVRDDHILKGTRPIGTRCK